MVLDGQLERCAVFHDGGMDLGIKGELWMGVEYGVDIGQCGLSTVLNGGED